MRHDDEHAYWAEEPVNLILQGRTPSSPPTDPDADAPTAGPTSAPTDTPAGVGLLADPAGPEHDPARWGIRGELNRLLGSCGRLRPTRREAEHRLCERAVQAQWSGTQLVMVANPKGGAGKTPTTLMLAATFARLRGGGVVGWDNNETRGTLAMRAAAPNESTVWDLLAHAPQLAAGSSAMLAAFLRRQPTREHILASDDSPEHMDQIGFDECADIYNVLARHYELVVADTGNNERAGNWQWTAQHAHQLVIPLEYREDTAKIVGGMIDRLTAAGRRDLVTDALVVASTAPHGTEPGIAEVVRAFLDAKGITRILEVPHDPILAGRSGRVVQARLAPATTRAWTRVAAEVALTLHETSQRRALDLHSKPPPAARRRPPAPPPAASRPTAPGNAPATRNPATELSGEAVPPWADDGEATAVSARPIAVSPAGSSTVLVHNGKEVLS